MIILADIMKISDFPVKICRKSVLDPVVLNNFVKELNDGIDGTLIKLKATKRWLAVSYISKPELKFKFVLHFLMFSISFVNSLNKNILNKK